MAFCILNSVSQYFLLLVFAASPPTGAQCWQLPPASPATWPPPAPGHRAFLPRFRFDCIAAKELPTCACACVEISNNGQCQKKLFYMGPEGLSLILSLVLILSLSSPSPSRTSRCCSSNAKAHHPLISYSSPSILPVPPLPSEVRFL